jgi:NADH:ubiquinone oxidoreductase subunit 5 (subunit L)/multisubunit Na+/H+ antiporter MnhA subunit
VLYLLGAVLLYGGYGTLDMPMLAGVLQAIAHATAKAGMFMAAGLVYAALGHDRIDDLAGAARALPITVLAFVIGGVALMGVVPSGAYLAKKLLLDSADQSAQWWWTWVLQGGAVFTAGYVVLVLARVLRRPAAPVDVAPVSMLSQMAALGLALASLLLSLAAVLGPLPSSLLSNPLSPMELGTTLAVLAGGTLLAAGLARRPLIGSGGSALRGMTDALGRALERGDYQVRRWPSAMLALLVIAALFGWLLVAR